MEAMGDRSAAVLAFPGGKRATALRSERDCCVYIIARNAAGAPATPIKVGIADNPSRRLKNLQTAAPFDLMMVHYFPMPSREVARFVEGAFHSTQANRNIRGEWFEINFVQVMQLMCLNIRAVLKCRASAPSSRSCHSPSRNDRAAVPRCAVAFHPTFHGCG
jgi:hypothetical protein